MLVSAVMPTRGRPEFSRRCVDCWRGQDWPESELILFDSLLEPSFPHGLEEPNIYYLRVRHSTIGALRNLLCQASAGEYIVHFDSDDWYGPHRISDQIEQLLASGKAVAGYRNIRFTDGKQWWLNSNWPGGYGATLCYRRDWWAQHPFPHSNEEDWPFVATAMQAGQFQVSDAGDQMYATIHPGNTAKRVIGSGWHLIQGAHD